MCLAPVTITRNYRNINERWENAAHNVPCGKCPKCLKRRAKAWSFRLHQEMKHSKSASFLTFTYAESPRTFNGYETLHKIHIQKAFKALKKRTGYGKLKYYLCGEYGSRTARPHYHAILLNANIQELPKLLEKIWPHGHFRIDSCNLATIHYVTGYLNKPSIIQTHELDDRQKEFSSMSKGIGYNYLTPAAVRYHTSALIGHVTTKGGAIQALPRYYKDKIFSKLERAEIAAEQKLIHEYKFDKFFKNPTHELEYKKDQYRKQQKNAKERSAF